ncbi:glycosyltransferase [Candidatus Pelagibacter sp. HIMB1542]|uniref:glycosyltransferase n=1 Tax=Candidatus Pelagibacter sp. HIMB1542 TaxID=3413346 RepID=UPI003F8364E9
MKKIPVVIFCYNRPDKIKKLLRCIKNNRDYKNYKYFFFCDGPKSDQDKKKCDEVLKIVKNFRIKNKNIIKNKINFGLSQNVIKGISKVFQTNKYAIILEDDLYISRNTLKFLSSMLIKYKNHNGIGSISAYSYLHNFDKIENNLYLVQRHCSWGWATWKNVWDNINWNNYRINKKNFSNGGFDLWLLLEGQKKNLINSWAIRFNLYCHNNNLKCIMPRFSFINNLGFDENGTHTKKNFFRKNILNIKRININHLMKQKPYESNIISKKIKFMHKPSIKLIIKLVLNFFQSNIENTKI